MNQAEIKKFLSDYEQRRERTIVIVDYGNVEKWKHSLHWSVDIKKLGKLVKHFSCGKKFLRRFYYGSDFGKNEKSKKLIPWSEAILMKAKMSGFEVVTKRVKYIRDSDNTYGYEKKCDLDVEMAIDIVKERDNYDTIILFSGDGDLMYAVEYMSRVYKKKCIVFGARNHIGREVFDAKRGGCLNDILYGEDFEYRLIREKNR